jgi:hypothetical protein
VALPESRDARARGTRGIGHGVLIRRISLRLPLPLPGLPVPDSSAG